MNGERRSDRFPAAVPDEAMLYLTTPDTDQLSVVEANIEASETHQSV